MLNSSAEKESALISSYQEDWFPWQNRMCYFGGDFGWACFWSIPAVFVVAEPLCDVRTPS